MNLPSPSPRRPVFRSRLDGRPRAHPLEPTTDIQIQRIDRLTDLHEESHEAVQQDVGQGETAAAQMVAAVGHLAVEPPDAVLRNRLQAGRGLGHGEDAVLEEVVALAEAETVGKRSEEHTSELQSRQYLVCRLLL